MGQTINDCCPCKYLIVVAVLWGEGGTQQNFLRGGLPFYTSGIPFLTKEVPFCIPFIDNWFIINILVYNVESLLTAANARFFT